MSLGIAFSALYFILNWINFKVYSVFVYLLILIALLLVAEYIFLKNAVKKMKNNKELSEDEQASCETEIDKLIAENVDKITKICADKEKDIMSV